MSPELLEVGRIDRAHGVRGQVIVRLVTNRAERVAPGSELIAGERVLRVRSSTPHHDRWIVTFEGVDDKPAADALRGVILSAPPIDDPDELWVHDLLGAMVVDSSGVERGRVVEVHPNPASDLLVLESGALVPLRFMVNFEPGTRIEVDVPDGLFDTA